MSAAAKMTTNRPYLIRAMYDWISDNGLTPYLLVDARADAVRVPAGAVKDGQVVLNVAVRAVSDLVVQALHSIKQSVSSVREYITGTASAVEEQSIVTQDMSSNMQRASAELA